MVIALKERPAAPVPGVRYEFVSPDAKMKGKALTAEDGAAIMAGDGANVSDPGWIEGYAAVFDNVDWGGDIIRRGAFTKTIAERVAAGKVKLMARHFRDGGDVLDVIGSVTEAKEDDFGLWIHADLSRAQDAQDVRLKILEGHVEFLSIGYTAVKALDTKVQDDSWVRELLEVKLMEITVTAIPMNELAAITAAKALETLARSMGADDRNLLESKEGRVLSKANKDRISGVLQALGTLKTNLEELISKAAGEEPKDAGKTAVPDSLALELRRRKWNLAKIL